MEQGAAPQPRSRATDEQLIRPGIAWAYFATNLVLVFGLGLWPVGTLLGLVAAVITYRERREMGFPAIWWTLAVFVFGPLAYLVFVYKRRRPAVAYPPETPPTAAAG
jgi:hypothetical protein